MDQVSCEQHWLIEPLLAAGLEPEEVRTLVFRLAFDALVAGDAGTTWSVARLVEDQPVHVQAAWVQTIDRMITVGSRAA